MSFVLEVVVLFVALFYVDMGLDVTSIWSMWHSERERERGRGRETEREKKRERKREREREIGRERGRREREKERESRRAAKTTRGSKTLTQPHRSA